MSSISTTNLEVVFDDNLNFRESFSQIVKRCFYDIRDLRRIRRYLPFSVANQYCTYASS